MTDQKNNSKKREWLRRYVPAEIIGTVLAVGAATVVYSSHHSFAAATGAGWVAEGIGFYGFFVIREIVSNLDGPAPRRGLAAVFRAALLSSRNLLVEFAPAEIIDSFFIRPALMFSFPHFIHPYPLGFLAGKLSADIVFYALAIGGYEVRKRIVRSR